MGHIRQLPDALVDQIAAGEVVERPASALKELVENALDAGARHIRVTLRRGGIDELIVSDDGNGMSADDLALAIRRHATSKLPDGRLDDIRFLGFRGEALPSIGAVSQLRITSVQDGDPHAWQIEVNAGTVQPVQPAALAIGTQVIMRQLFKAVPARLKFLKTERTEQGRCVDVMRRLAMAWPQVAFFLSGDGRTLLDLAACGDGDAGRARRLADVMGRTFAGEAMIIDAQRDTVRLSGMASLPTMNRPTPASIFLFVNGRPVQDRSLLGAIRAGYGDTLPRGRHPMAALFLTVPAESLDVNVHPAKTEVRFRDAAGVRALLVGALSAQLQDAGIKTTAEGGDAAARLLAHSGAARGFSAPPGARYETPPADWQAPIVPAGGTDRLMQDLPPAARPAEAENAALQDVPAGSLLGAARAQLHKTYIVAETGDGITIIDQHAAHERLVMERMKAAIAADGVAKRFEFEEDIRLAAQFVGDHGRLRPHGGDHGHALALALHGIDQAAEIAVAGKQHDMVQLFGHFHHVDGQLDIHVAFDLAASGGVGEFLGRLGDHGVAVIVQPVDQRADRRILLVLDHGGVVEGPDQPTFIRENSQKTLVVDVEIQRPRGGVKV